MPPREDFPIKKPGDSLEADHVNALGRGIRDRGRSGSYQRGVKGRVSGSPPFDMQKLEIDSRDVEDGYEQQNRYRAYPRYYDHDEEEWKTDKNVNYVIVDTSDESGVVLFAGQKIHAWYHSERDAYVPVFFSRSRDVEPFAPPPSYMDVRCKGVSLKAQEPVQEKKEIKGDDYIEVALEGIPLGDISWRVVNGRSYIGNFDDHALEEDCAISTVTVVGIYSFTVTGVGYIRLKARNIGDSPVTVEWAAIRVLAISRGGVSNSFSPALQGGKVLSVSTLEGARQPGLLAGVPAMSKFGSVLKIQVPSDTWQFKAEIALRATAQATCSSSSISTSSTSSSSSSSSSISTSSTSSSSISTSSSGNDCQDLGIADTLTANVVVTGCGAACENINVTLNHVDGPAGPSADFIDPETGEQVSVDEYWEDDPTEDDFCGSSLFLFFYCVAKPGHTGCDQMVMHFGDDVGGGDSYAVRATSCGGGTWVFDVSDFDCFGEGGPGTLEVTIS